MTCGYLPHVKPGDGPSDDHALNLRRALQNGEARRGTGSFRSAQRASRCAISAVAPICRHGAQGLPALSGSHDAVAEVRGRLGHPQVVGDYCSKVLAQPAGSGEVDGVQ